MIENLLKYIFCANIKCHLKRSNLLSDDNMPKDKVAISFSNYLTIYI